MDDGKDDRGDDGKVCATCKQWQPLTAYNRRARAADGLQSRCRACSRAWYLRNAETHKANTSRRAREARSTYRQRLCAYLLTRPCVDCGEDDVVVLEFDHREPGSKEREVARLLNDLVAWSTVEAEIAKCDVRCANCHRRRTSERAQQARHLFERQRRAEEAAVLDALFAEVMGG